QIDCAVIREFVIFVVSQIRKQNNGTEDVFNKWVDGLIDFIEMCEHSIEKHFFRNIDIDQQFGFRCPG
ncbi:MAG: hypothetical protein IK117_03525, partial [Bacteroidales bacterium]|nr:hypothetical protein [Bacteroidales bacterium]